LLGFSFSWSENLAALSKHFTVYAPDLLNVGYSDRCELEVDLQSGANQLLEFMDAVGIESADVLGTSYGGTIVMALAATAPERVQRLILVAPAHCGSEGVRWQSRLFSTRIGAVIAQLLYLAPAFVHGWFIGRMYAVPSRVRGGTVKEYAAAVRISGTIAPLVKLMQCWDRNFQELAGMMPKIANIPTLLVWGEKDFVVPIQTMPDLARSFKQCSIAQIEDAGHLPYEELPEEFNRAVLGFCSQLLL
jgi:pimeloyl-ACP methyl ester carboxylesterase